MNNLWFTHKYSHYLQLKSTIHHQTKQLKTMSISQLIKHFDKLNIKQGNNLISHCIHY